MKFVLYPNSYEQNVNAAIEYIKGLSREKVHQIDIGPFNVARSAQQNRALFGLAYPMLSNHTGINVDDLHEYFLMKKFGVVETIVFGRKKFKPFRTTTTDEHGNGKLLSTQEFADFYSFIQIEAAKLGCNIPDPVRES